jgi:NAD(P)-dependent dehydrogenase (short-subunit alcohol dehydrogenase family)
VHLRVSVWKPREQLSSSAHRAADVDLDDPGFQQTPYDPFGASGRSKTANVLFAVELDRRLRNRRIRATALHPGGIHTELMRHTTPDMLQQMAARSGRDVSSPQQRSRMCCRDTGVGRKQRCDLHRRGHLG